MTNDEVQAILAPFYKQALTVNTETTSTAVLEKILAQSFQSINSQGTKDNATLIQQVAGFWKLIPDLVWAPQDLVIGVDGKKSRGESGGHRLTQGQLHGHGAGRQQVLQDRHHRYP